MNTLTQAGAYLSTINCKEYIIVVEGNAPMLKVTRALDLTAFINEGKLEISSSAIEEIYKNPDKWDYKPLDINTILKVSNDTTSTKNVEYTSEEFAKWCLSYEKVGGNVLTAMMIEKNWNYQQAEIVLKEIQKQLTKKLLNDVKN